jgi:hypothetical protein
VAGLEKCGPEGKKKSKESVERVERTSIRLCSQYSPNGEMPDAILEALRANQAEARGGRSSVKERSAGLNRSVMFAGIDAAAMKPKIEPDESPRVSLNTLEMEVNMPSPPSVESLKVAHALRMLRMNNDSSNSPKTSPKSSIREANGVASARWQNGLGDNLSNLSSNQGDNFEDSGTFEGTQYHESSFEKASAESGKWGALSSGTNSESSLEGCTKPRQSTDESQTI